MISEYNLCPLMTRDPSHPVLCTKSCAMSLPYVEGGWTCAFDVIASSINSVAVSDMRAFPREVSREME